MYLCIDVYVYMDVCLYMFVCIYMYVDVCEFVCVFLLFIRIKRKCGLKRIHKVVGHKMYVINILVCGSYGNF